MSGDWIKMRNNLWDDPRVSRLCDLTSRREACVIGGLYWLWAMADEHTEDGHLPGLTLAGIDRKTGLEGFAAALVEIGWLSETMGGVTLERFAEHNGSSAKRRCLDAQRKAASRSVSASDADKVRTDDGQDAPDGGRNAPKCGAREEKRREEKRRAGVGGVSESVGADGAQTTKGARLPKDWKLPKAWGEWAVGEFPHWTPDTVRRVAEGFRDHWTSKAGADARKTDWLATWRNWCRSDITQRSTAPARKTNGQAHHGTSYADRKDAEALNAAYLIGAIHRPAPVTDTIDHEDDPHAPRRLTS